MKLKNICLSAMFVVVAVPAFAAEDSKKPDAAEASKKPVAAEASKKPVTNWTCDDFLSIDDVFRPKVVYAATPHVKTSKPKDVIDTDETEKVIPVIIAECEKARQSAFLRELEGAWAKVEADTKAMEKKM
jgi:acid stress chaperone HdeA